ncbi:hypothetical protein ACJIZ3_022391 [Penstemon smallii]|uniref:F-box associated beta-propeller type 3 domain-containing protein n=1 Tax=Penstemon smallii TaxID=265156 RepID=A0ABD3TLA2_9LAMI
MNPTCSQQSLPYHLIRFNRRHFRYKFKCFTNKHSDHYKVLRIVGTPGRRIHVEIFTIGVDKKWRSFEDSSIPCLIFEFGVNLNGVVYFVGGVVRDSGLILAFDMEEERGHRISLPSEFGDKRSNIALAVCNGNLCLTDNSNEHQVVIWTMKRNGVMESWSKEIMMKSWIPLDLSFDRLIHVMILRNEDLLMSHQSSLFDNSNVVIIYNPKTNECSTHEFSDGEKESSYLFVYVPSFFPLSTVL